MKLDEYQNFCRHTYGYNSLGDKDKQIMALGLGISGEAGDVAGCIKKTYGHKNNQTEGIKENLGDTLWYIASICNFYDWNISEILDENVDKLKQRYPDGFDSKRAKRDGKKVDWNE